MISHIFRRLLVVLVGYGVSCVVAGVSLWLAYLAADFLAQNGSSEEARAALAWVFSVGVFSAVTLGVIAFVPASIFIAISEVRRVRSVGYFLLSGLTLGLGFAAMMRFSREAVSSDPLNVPVFAIAGALGGIAYWLTAGRSAGARTV